LTERVCLGIELDPKYVDVAIQTVLAGELPPIPG
jgi:DNA modification methylase